MSGKEEFDAVFFPLRKYYFEVEAFCPSKTYFAVEIGPMLRK
jgi:hypothetical protein